jgi:HD superfamily phosphodiesterase
MSLEHEQEFYKQEDIDDYKSRNIRPDGTIIDCAKHSSNLEYELSLKEVAKRMYTETGKKLAKERSAFMDEFYSRLGKELKGII